MENTMNNRNEIPQQVKQVVSIAETLLQGQILGMYLYGSATMNKLRPDSDIDILIITRQELNLSTKKELTKQLLEISGFVGCAEKRPLEITVIHQKDIIPWQFPPKCEYMYGEWLRKEMEAGMIPQACFDPDIAILLWQARKSSMTLKGADCKQLILPIPFREIQKAIQFSLPGLISNVKGEDVTTKDVAAEWVIPQLPETFSSLLKTAKEAYLGNLSDEWETMENETLALTGFMKGRIEELLKAKG